MKRFHSVLSVFMVVALLVGVITLAACGNGGEDTYRAAVELARTKIWEDINAGKASSGSFAILDGGTVVHAEGIGTADREKSIPVDEQTLFNIGSVSKTFCTASIMFLVDEGKIDLDAPAKQYLPEFEMEDPRYEDITLRMLLDHTSGVPGTEYANNMGYAYNDDIYEETMGTLARSHLKAAPGGTAPYCNDGFTIAEMIVAEVSGLDYIDFVSERVCDPLSLSRTGASVGERPDAGYARYYQSDTGKKVPAEVLSVHGAGGLSSTPTELVLFADSFCEGGRGILSDESIAEMTKPQRSEFASACIKEYGINPEMAYGLGFDLVEFPPLEEKGIKVIGKGGDSDDYHTMLLAVPGERVAVAATVAGQGSGVETFTFDILTSVLEAKGLVAKAFGGPLMMVAAEMIPAAADPQSLSIDPDGKFWLRRNVKPFEAIGLAGTHVIESATYPDLPGYVDFAGLKVVTSPETAGMISDVVRDESELNLVDMDGETWAWVSNMLFSPDSHVEALSESGKSVTIGEDGYNKWFSAEADLVLKVEKPDLARVIVFSADYEPVYDSKIDKGDIYVQAAR